MRYFILVGLLAGLVALLCVFKYDTVTLSASNSLYPANIEYDGNQPAPYGSYESSNLTNPNIAGVDIIMDWADVEPSQGSFNWTPADNEIAAWAKAGKKFTVIVRYIREYKSYSDCSHTQYLPSWEAARIPTLCRTGGALLPDYFNATFKADFLAYVQAIASHIAASPYKSHLEYIRTGLGEAGESYPCIGCSSSDLQTLQNWGYSVSNWASWQEAMLNSYKNIFTYAPIIYPLGDSDTDPTTGQTVQQEVGYWAGAHGFGVGQQGLVDTPGYINSSIVKICQYVRQHYPSAYIQFQTVSTLASASQLQTDIKTADGAGAFSVEWYNTDTINSSYQPYFASWQQILDARTGTQPPGPNPSPNPNPSPSPNPNPSPSPSSNPGSSPAQTNNGSGSSNPAASSPGHATANAGTGTDQHGTILGLQVTPSTVLEAANPVAAARGVAAFLENADPLQISMVILVAGGVAILALWFFVSGGHLRIASFIRHALDSVRSTLQKFKKPEDPTL